MSVDEAYSNDANSGRKLASAFRTIGEVAEELDVPQHILRFWEKKFNQLEPVKQRGRRYYRPEDIELLNTIKTLLYKEGYTIKGVQKHLLHCDTAPSPDESQLALFSKNETVLKSPKKQASDPLLQDVLGRMRKANETLKGALVG